MKTIATSSSFLDGKAALGVLIRFEDDTPSENENKINEALGGVLARNAERTRFKGKPRQAVTVDTLGKLPFETILLLGVGKRSELTRTAYLHQEEEWFRMGASPGCPR